MRKQMSARKSIFNKLYPYIREGRKHYFMLGGLKVWMLALSLLMPLLYLVLVNNIMVQGNTGLLVYVLAGYIGIYLLQTLGVVANKLFYNKLFLKFCLKIKARILKLYTKIDAAAYTKYNAGDLKNRMEGDIEIVERFFTEHILDYFYAVISAGIITIIMLYLNWVLALTGLFMVPVSFWFVKFMGNKIKMVQEQFRSLDGRYESFLHAAFQNWKEIKANNLEQAQNDIFQDYRGKLSKLFVKRQVYWYTNRTFIAFKDFFITKMNLYFIGGLLIIKGHMDVGMLLVFMNYYAQFFDNISTITDSILGIKRDLPNIERVLEVLHLPVSEKPLVKNLSDHIMLRDMSFRYYNEQSLVLDSINLEIKPKEHVAIVGRSGSGKTTLARLMMGLYQPESGDIWIGGHNLKELSFESIGRKIGIVLQDPPLFNLTVRENLRLAKRSASDGELADACRRAGIFEFIELLPDGFDAIIGERGIKLSGGQKQRLAIARTFLQNPDVIIFDEATSSLDSKNEKLIVNAVANLSKGKTIITIAHRLSTVLGCDRVIVLDAGRIVSDGKHSELRGRNQIYDLLFEGQYQAVDG